MTQDEALEFLRNHQPMPATRDLEQADIDRYDEVRRYFRAHPHPDCVPLLLNSFGEGDGFGVYQLVGDVIRQFPHDQVVPHLARSLRSTHYSVRYWSAQIACMFAHEDLIAPLSELLTTGDYDMRYSAVTALESIDSPSVDTALLAALDREADDEIADLIRDVLAEREAARRQ